jgi:Bacteriocin-protection, YdeI or OmpD-Associated/Domain of unknown function (DUF1905)
MKDIKQYCFKAEIYKTGINFCVDVPDKITSKLERVKGYIKTKGTVNGFPFTKSLVPVKKGPYRLFVNIQTLKGGQTKVGEIANFVIEQNFESTSKEYSMPELLKQQLKQNNLTADFDNLSQSRKKDILRYLNYIKKEETLVKNIQKVVNQLVQKQKTARIP